MDGRQKILAISGSTRDKSSNLNLIQAINTLRKRCLNLNIFKGLTDIPHLNPDLDNEHVSSAVTSFRYELSVTDAIIICTPEYALGVSGALKNAIDWIKRRRQRMALLQIAKHSVKFYF